ncbi:outer membrane protein assembly factor BamB [Inmirania thermothiophila]|uniref:Outer membrane protein assembly factor BamB n=1 Tax=Inmirania thermothiophila TaxID=1750597 RepID=A0A3N1XSW7_9GAMM|nr:outer membrane protein assembly factor BamB [Inmirania thermothiophila]ROR29746.1 Beta-barrel assembly machine subunit BamB [Inmirania thermothiophila]
MTRAALLAMALLLAGCGGAEVLDPPAPLPADEGVAPLVPRWRLPLAGAVEGLRPRPAVAGDRVLAMAPAGEVVAAGLEDGRVHWRAAAGTGLTAGVGVGEGLAVAAGGEGEVLAFALEDGRLRWRVTVEGEVLAPPTVAGGRVFLRTAEGRLLALDAADGRRLWVQEQAVPALSLRGTARAVPSDGAVVTGWADGRVSAHRVADGAPLWVVRLATPRGTTEPARMVDVDADPVVADGQVYAAAYQGRIGAIAAGGGVLLWARDLSVWSGIAVAGEAVVASAADGVVWALERAGGRALWRQEALRNRRLSGPVLHAGLLWVGDLEGWVHALDPADGALRGRVRAGEGQVLALVATTAGLLVRHAEGLTLLAAPRGG